MSFIKFWKKEVMLPHPVFDEWKSVRSRGTVRVEIVRLKNALKMPRPLNRTHDARAPPRHFERSNCGTSGWTSTLQSLTNSWRFARLVLLLLRVTCSFCHRRVGLTIYLLATCLWVVTQANSNVILSLFYSHCLRVICKVGVWTMFEIAALMTEIFRKIEITM